MSRQAEMKTDRSISRNRPNGLMLVAEEEEVNNLHLLFYNVCLVFNINVYRILTFHMSVNILREQYLYTDVPGKPLFRYDV